MQYAPLISPWLYPTNQLYIGEPIAPIIRFQMAAIFVFAFLLIIVSGPGMAQERFVHCQLSTVTDADFGNLDLSLKGPF